MDRTTRRKMTILRLVADEFMCFFCLEVCKSNHGHHIFFYSECGDATVENMITLCPKCHRLYHNGKLNIELGRF